jgi:hypothetical protein
LVGVVDEDSVDIVRFVRTMLLLYVHSVFCDMSHEQGWLLTCATLIALLLVYR